ncbi:hypothetical protein [Nannocystis radixulma]|uniref:VapC45 PIN like domain-containing protein n=1 Tax=Nannocystis radixulma TaxID=2995305 RepID=A0ABT5B146_9BACT|nr:hypothetical protein [Nannocystis radixulma]MDC0666892.1 hypothetical protein [Nannocystis radixulma]
MRALPRLHEPFTFFVDECLGGMVVLAALRAWCDAARGESIKTLPQGTLDVEWLPQAGENGWVCFSKDRQMHKRPNELQAIIKSGVGLFTLGEGSGAQHARLIVDGLPMIRRLAKQLDRAFIARLEPDGNILVTYANGERLADPRRYKPKIGERPRKV